MHVNYEIVERVKLKGGENNQEPVFISMFNAFGKLVEVDDSAFCPLPYRKGALLFFFWPLPPVHSPEIELKPTSCLFISARRLDPELRQRSSPIPKRFSLKHLVHCLK